MAKAESEQRMRELREEGLSRGRLVELTLGDEDIVFDDMAPIWFAHKSDTPSRRESKLVGYVAEIKEDSFYLTTAWNVTEDRPLADKGSTSYRIYAEAVKTYRVL